MPCAFLNFEETGPQNALCLKELAVSYRQITPAIKLFHFILEPDFAYFMSLFFFFVGSKKIWFRISPRAWWEQFPRGAVFP